MIVCAECGTSNRENERFCGECGTFLEWEGAVVTPSASPRTTPAEQPRETVDAQVTTTTADAQGSRTAPGTGTSGAVPPPTAPGTAATTTGTTATGTTPTTGSTKSEPLPDRPTDPVAVQPGQVQHRRPVRPVTQDQPETTGGDRICPRCQAGNDELRRFCRACGALLVETEAPVRRSWWRRLLDRIRGRNRDPRRRRDGRAAANARRLLKIVALICLLVVLAIAGPPLVSRAVSEVRDRIQDPVPLTPQTVTASSAGESTPATRIADGVTNRYWSPTGPAVGAWVEATFASPVRILDIIVTPGISLEQGKFLTVGRPGQLDLVATTSDGTVVERTIKLRDQPGPQPFKFEASGVVRLKVVVRSIHGPQSEPTVAIGEVEFFGRM
ncbi:zinc ribbon domain-containing protein [Micromonospora sonneratiae]|uniref:Zinc-ribbon domain-containing protein n=1 Tax=Micromonospora sonneratiae TaxID=1184706 RepID=A0ABW3YK99_9ACTN